jgi:16S rRNA (adenine1518-N6/adenine1519-N6)-dimethyltransferase
MKLTEMREILAANQIQLSKSLGQNFLHDTNQLRRIAEAADLAPGEQVLEIGPGLGPLTQVLLAAGAKVFAIEKDRRLVDFLSKHFAGMTNLTLTHDDALEYLRRDVSDWSDWKVVSNLPYSVASPIIVELAKKENSPRRIVATLQLEVADRLTASAQEEHYGVLTLLVQARYEVRDSFKIPASCFFPVPDVDSACVTLVRRTVPLLQSGEFERFEKIVKRGFSQRRKMMMKLLKEDWAKPTLEKAFHELGLSSSIRAESVALEQFVQLTRILNQPERRHDK